MVKQFDPGGTFGLAVLSRRLETLSRVKILTQLESILGPKDFHEIVGQLPMWGWVA